MGSRYRCPHGRYIETTDLECRRCAADYDRQCAADAAEELARQGQEAPSSPEYTPPAQVSAAPAEGSGGGVLGAVALLGLGALILVALASSTDAKR